MTAEEDAGQRANDERTQQYPIDRPQKPVADAVRIHLPPALSRWRKQIFILMSNNALDATEFFRIPPNRVAESGPERPVVRQGRGV
jgi:hypothetical protein